MKIKIFSVELQANFNGVSSDTTLSENAAKIASLEEEVNNYMEAHPEFVKCTWKQSSGGGHSWAFTRITVTLKTA